MIPQVFGYNPTIFLPVLAKIVVGRHLRSNLAEGTCVGHLPNWVMENSANLVNLTARSGELF